MPINEKLRLRPINRLIGRPLILGKFVCTPDSWDVVSLELLSLYFISIISFSKDYVFSWLEMHKILQPETNYSVQFFIQCVSVDIF